jgi:hypothetical protein
VNDHGTDAGDSGRRDWVDMVSSWGKDAQLSGSEEGVLVRHYDEWKEELARAMESVAEEYKQRLGEDGKAKADNWLAEAAAELGRRDGEATRRLFESIP